MFIYLWTMRQEREFLALRASIQATIGGDNNQKAIQSSYQDLQNAFNPYLEGAKEDEKKKLHERVAKEVNRGTLSVTPTGPAMGDTNYGALRKKLTNDYKEMINKNPTQDSLYTKRRNRNATTVNRNGSRS